MSLFFNCWRSDVLLSINKYITHFFLPLLHIFYKVVTWSLARHRMLRAVMSKWGSRDLNFSESGAMSLSAPCLWILGSSSSSSLESSLPTLRSTTRMSLLLSRSMWWTRRSKERPGLWSRDMAVTNGSPVFTLRSMAIFPVQPDWREKSEMKRNWIIIFNNWENCHPLGVTYHLTEAQVRLQLSTLKHKKMFCSAELRNLGTITITTVPNAQYII